MAFFSMHIYCTKESASLILMVGNTFQVSTKEEDVNNNISDLSLMKEDMCTTAERCAQIYIEYSSKRKEVGCNNLVLHLTFFLCARHVSVKNYC